MAERRVVIGNTVTEIVPYNKGRTIFTFHNFAGETLFFSRDRSLTTANGFPVPVGSTVTFAKTDGDPSDRALYGIVATTSTDIGVSESFESLPEDKLLRALEARAG